MILFYEDVILQLCCHHLRVRFELSTKFVDNAGRPRLSFVVDASPSVCGVLEACDDIVRKLFVESGSNSDWRPVLNRKPGFFNYPTHTHFSKWDVAKYETEIYQKDPCGTTQKLMFSKFDAAELVAWFRPGTFLDAYISLHPYDFQQSAGIRLVAKKLVIHKE
ncbi:hypothetical protein GH714_041333 [Hevea brasiliensis]|uniref:Uncharacterized protein n=1 Tax=Hevea brasiliensis TaxID=3981 RepID=A0A6A6N0C8_HEVBR|nr:hypothetical protein GH714_041333 [Hevea brasiliensis]